MNLSPKPILNYPLLNPFPPPYPNHFNSNPPFPFFPLMSPRYKGVQTKDLFRSGGSVLKPFFTHLRSLVKKQDVKINSRRDGQQGSQSSVSVGTFN